ncbi:MAG: hypothetical protein MSC30_01310 [Gaiellaceae bacterium MAG52_C11]|nr:hypothetical protein [Candidatus Gaiellasilicea maunaloa]
MLEELVTDVAPVRRNLHLFQVLTGSRGRVLDALSHGHRLSSPAPGRFHASVDGRTVAAVELSMRECADAIEQGAIRIDGALLTAVRIGDEGWPVPATDLAVAAFEHARFRAVEVLGGWSARPTGPSFSFADVDYLVTSDGAVGELTPAPKTPVSRVIGECVAELVPDNAVIELGVGAALASVAECLVESGRPLGIHTGLASDWVRELVEGGVATRLLSCACNTPAVAAVAMGSGAFDEWLRRTGAVSFADSRHTHDAQHLMTLRPFVAINSAAAVALDGRVGLPAGTTATHPPGGLRDFALAGMNAGLSIIAMTARSRDGRSRIVDDLGRVHLPAGLVTHVVTEHGVANLRGKPREEARAALLAIAGPPFDSDVHGSPGLTGSAIDTAEVKA